MATAATVGTVALPQIKRYGYNEPLFLGSLAAGGTLGILIPPSINLVIYGVLTNSSVPKLYPGRDHPGLHTGRVVHADRDHRLHRQAVLGWPHDQGILGERFASLVHLLPPLGIFMLVVGSIYAGLATPTKAAALGVFGALVLAAWHRRLTFSMLREAIEGTMLRPP